MEFEKNLKSLETIVEKMSDEKLSLNEALKAFEKGMQMIKKCREDLNQAEQKVEKLIKIHEDGTAETEPFDSTDLADK
ncbi:MAG: exodeoxyribonuclease VII small subunit [Bdellovibrionales bacterium]|nr:exodeoxyribonuclease VII small subunit [Bdellovibrionales bacterium]